jgi:DNA polymerase-3 subunit delta
MTEKGPLGLRSRDTGGVFFLHGQDEFRKEEEARALVEWFVDPATRDFNFDALRGSEVAADQLASILATPPMMAVLRVVVLREVEALAGSSRARETLLEVVNAPPPGLALILLCTVPKGSKAKFYSELSRKAQSREYREVGPNDVPGWLMTWVRRRHGQKMTEEAARALSAGAGFSLGVLAQEVEKLSSLVGEGEEIGLEAVKMAGTQIPTEDRWLWMDRVGRREFEDALKGLEVLFRQGETGVSLTTGLTTHLLRLALGKAGGAKALEAALPRHLTWLGSRLAKDAHGWSQEFLDGAILGLRRVDRLLKSSSLPDEQIMEEWLLGLMATERTRTG